MKRIWAAMVTAILVIIAGCGEKEYEKRTETTLTELKRQQKINNRLAPAAEGKLKEMNVYLRVPDFMTENPLALNQTPGAFDFGATYAGAPAPPAPAADSKAPAPAPLPPMRLHVLVRQKPKKAAAKKGEPPPAIDPNIANRGPFLLDVRNVLAAEYGPDAASEKAPQAFTAKGASYKRQIFNAANGNTVQIYFADANKGDLETALVFEVPPVLLKVPRVVESRDLCLEEFRLGAKARGKFNGNATEGAQPGVPAEGPVF